jgi:hypothetical protein
MNELKDGLDVRLQSVSNNRSKSCKLTEKESSMFGLASFRYSDHLWNHLINV